MKKRLLALLTLLTLLVGCLGLSTVALAEEAQPVEEFSIDWYVNLSWWAWGGIGWNEDLVSQTIKEKTGVTINFITPATDGGEQLSTMVAADTLPDIITVQGLWDSTDRMLAYQLAMEGYLTSYDELIEMNPALGEVARQDVLDWYRETDGKTYMYPNYAYSSEDLAPGEKLVPNRAITVRKDLWEQIGSPDMSTPEAFLAACKKAQDEIGTYDGKEIIGLQLYEGAMEALSIMNQYFATPIETPEGVKVYDFDMPGTKESLAFLNEAYRMGLITDANFSDTRDMINEKVASGRVFAMITAPQDFIQQMGALYDTDPNAVYQTMVLRNSAGDDPILSDISGWGWLMTGVSSKTERPDLVANLIEFLLSDEGQILCTYGVEGVTYNYNDDGTITMTDEYYAAVNANDAKKYGVGAMTLFGNYAFTRQFDTDLTDPRAIATNDIIIKTPMTPYSYNFASAGGKEDPANPDKTAMTELRVRLTNYRNTAIAELITADSPEAFEAKYDEVVQTLKDMGIETINAYDDQWFQAAKEAMDVDFFWPPYQTTAE